MSGINLAFDYGALAPMLLIFAVAIIGVLVEAFAGRPARKALQGPLALGAIAVAFVLTIVQTGSHLRTASGSLGTAQPEGYAVAVDGPTLFIWGTILVLALASLLLLASPARLAGGTPDESIVGQAAAVPGSPEEEEAHAHGTVQTEVYPLALFAIGGMLLFPAANDLLTMFIALEVLSLPLYLMCAFARRRRLLSQEAAMKYFLLGAFSSGFFLYGAALIYGYAGTLDLSAISLKLGEVAGMEPMLYGGAALLAVGLLFKLGAAPFHAWKPDVYQGAPTPVTALMATTTVVAAFGAILRVFWVGLGDLDWDLSALLWAITILTMIVGAVLAITQTDIKRMLAYSSIAHAGFILTGVVATGAPSQQRVALSAVLFYLVVYGFTTVGAFAVVTMVRDPGGEAWHLSRWAGLGKRSPLLGGVFGLFLLGFAGIPLTSGFWGKYAVFSAAVSGGAWPLAVVGVVASAVAAFFYVRVIVLMFFSEPSPEGPTIAVPGMGTVTVVAVAAAATVVLGVYPPPVLNLAEQAASALFVS